MAVHEKLLKIQSSISVPKNQYNKFGNYDYRSCEDILSALKPILQTHKCTVTVNDDLIFIGNRYYIKATASSYARKYALNGLLLLDDVKDADTNENQQQSQNAKDDKNQQRSRNAGANKNQQKSQNAGANKDSKGGTQKKLIDKKELDALRKRFKDDGVDETKVCSAYKVSDLSQLSVSQHENITQHFEQVKEKCAA